MLGLRGVYGYNLLFFRQSTRCAAYLPMLGVRTKDRMDNVRMPDVPKKSSYAERSYRIKFVPYLFVLAYVRE